MHADGAVNRTGVGVGHDLANKTAVRPNGGARGSGGPAGGVVLLVAGQVCGGVAAPLVGEFTYVDDSGESCDCKHGVSGMQQAQQAGPHAATYEQENYVSKFRLHTTKAIRGG